MAITNKEKTPPKSDIKFSVSLSEEQKEAKAKIIETPFNFLLGKAGSGKTLLAVQIALDMFFKRRIDKIIITRRRINLMTYLQLECRFYSCQTARHGPL